MAILVPFRGIRYNPKQIERPEEVVAPPYDVINPKEQEDLYQRHPNNVVRLILGKILPNDDDQDNRYTRAAASYKGWQEEGVLIQDTEPMFYIYCQEFQDDKGNPVKRKGFFGLAKLADFGEGTVYPHERTLQKPKEDRFQLMKACEANLSSIFTLYPDQDGQIDKILEKEMENTPLVTVPEIDGVKNTLWGIKNPEAIRAINGAIQDKSLFIADGHHRYETALMYRNHMREKYPEDKGERAFNYLLVYCNNFFDPGLIVLPIHRLVHSVKSFSEGKFLSAMEELFDVQPVSVPEKDHVGIYNVVSSALAEGKEKGTRLGVVMASGKTYLCEVKDRGKIEEALQGVDPALRGLDITVLHSIILEGILGITREAQAKQENLVYIKSNPDGVRQVLNGEGQMCFLLNPTPAQKVQEVSLAGQTMPQKSTFFFPKILSGMLINPIDPEEKITPP